MSFAILALAVITAGPSGSAIHHQVDDMREFRVGNLTYAFPSGYERGARALAERVEALPALPGLPADGLTGGEIRIVLVAEPEIFDSLAPGAPDWSGGLAFLEEDLILIPIFGERAGPVPLAAILRHEIAHIALTRYLGAGVPRWFHEGYAQLASGSFDANEAWALRFAILAGKVPSFEVLRLDFRRDPLTAKHAYWLAYTAVEGLVRLGGEPGFQRLLERWRETGDLDSALRRTYGLTLGHYERIWQREVKSRYGWLLIVTQATTFWAALTILFVALGYWKKQRNKAKLAQLEIRVREREALERRRWMYGEEASGSEMEDD